MSDPLMRGERVLAESEPKIVNEVSILPNKAVAETPFKNKLGVLDAPAVSEYLTPPESVEEAKARDRLLWDILEEALNRGADADDLVELQFRYRRKRRPRANEVPRVNYLPASEDLDVTLVGDPASMTPEEEFAVKFSLEFVRLALVAYRRKAMSEFDRLDPRVRDTFKLRDKDAFEHYVEARPMYHNAGYTNPVAEVFAHLRPAVIVGRQVLVHAEYADKLAALDALLRAQGATLPEDVAQKITEAGG
ncbi:MAG TPA: hypothetical protein VE360_18260, partial [Pyrinomonadaceae bacterium]|nr:hypothetical protein [Pyrinomonadaceae bacterium]